MLMHISPGLGMWIFFSLIIGQDSTAFSSVFNENLTKYGASRIYRQFSPNFVVHIIHIIHIFVWIDFTAKYPILI